MSQCVPQTSSNGSRCPSNEISFNNSCHLLYEELGPDKRLEVDGTIRKPRLLANTIWGTPANLQAALDLGQAWISKDDSDIICWREGASKH